jgi:hypothetical protein
MVVQAMLRPPFDYILSYDPLLQLTIYPDPLLPFTLFNFQLSSGISVFFTSPPFGGQVKGSNKKNEDPLEGTKFPIGNNNFTCNKGGRI